MWAIYISRVRTAEAGKDKARQSLIFGSGSLALAWAVYQQRRIEYGDVIEFQIPVHHPVPVHVPQAFKNVPRCQLHQWPRQ